MRKTRYMLLLLLLCYSLPGYAQENSHSRISLDLNGSTSILKNSFTNSWEPSLSPHLGLRINYHFGSLEAGVRYTSYSGGRSDFSEYEESAFTSLFIYAGWEYPFRLAPNLSLAPGFRFGNSFLTFDHPATYPPEGAFGKYEFDPHESEFAYELFVRLEYALAGGPWSLHTGFSYNRTLTYHHMPLGLISVGLSRSFTTPSWLKDFLQ